MSSPSPGDASRYVRWHPDIPWEPEMYVRSEGYELMPALFPEVVPSLNPGNSRALTPEHYRESADGRWRFARRILKGGEKLLTHSGARTGDIRFDAPITFSALWERKATGGRELWMSLTPMEHFTLRGGARRAKGHTVIAGLGMGYQLWLVARRYGRVRRRQHRVERITVIERSQSLIDFVMPALRPLLGDVPVEVVCGDAYKVLPQMKADVALVDIFPTYGNNRDDMEQLERSAPGVKAWWGWGTVSTGEGDRMFVQGITSLFI